MVGALQDDAGRGRVGRGVAQAHFLIEELTHPVGDVAVAAGDEDGQRHVGAFGADHGDGGGDEQQSVHRPIAALGVDRGGIEARPAFKVAGQPVGRLAAPRVSHEHQAAHVGHAGQRQAEAVVAAPGRHGQRRQMPVDDLLQPLAAHRLAEAEGVLGIDVDRQSHVAASGQFAHQILEAGVVVAFHVGIAGPDIDSSLVDGAAGVRAVQDEHDGERAVAGVGHGQHAVEPHGHVVEAAVFGEGGLG